MKSFNLRSRLSVLILFMLVVPTLAGASNTTQARTRHVNRTPTANCNVTSMPFTAMMDMQTDFYQGYQGSLYPNGSN